MWQFATAKFSFFSPASLHPVTLARFSFIFLGSGGGILQVVDPILSTENNFALAGVANTNLTIGSETPVDAFPPNEMGLCDTQGNAWEW